MKTKDIKKNINNEMESMISSNFDSVISRIEKKKGVIIEMEKDNNQKVADRCNTTVSNLDCPNHGTAWSYRDNTTRPQMTDAFSPI